MQVAEASVVIPLSPEETWDLVFSDIQQAIELVPAVVSVEDFQIRDDGTPRYRMVRKTGPFTMSFIADYSVFERPHRAVNRVLDTPLGGTFYATHEPTTEGTQVHWRWEIEPQNALVERLLPVMRPLLAWSLQRDLNAAAKAAKNYQTIKAALQARGESSAEVEATEAAERRAEELEVDPEEVEGSVSSGRVLAADVEEAAWEAAATDAAQRKAEELGIDLATVEGTGADGRITVGDVQRTAKEQGKKAD
jgi:pyruvate/2-oxoglutarate dehydrogenase complex dihydrolipoamide acyltransferase (E2) component